MKKYDEHLQKQLDKPITWFVKYFPVRIRNVGEKEFKARQLVFDFKDGRFYEDVAFQVATYLRGKYGYHCSEMVLACIPASSAESTEKRYKEFYKRVSELSGITAAYGHIFTKGERPSLHENRKKENELRKIAFFDLDNEWFAGKDVVVFDDIITRGISYAAFADQLEKAGAKVHEGLFLARTHYKVKMQ